MDKRMTTEYISTLVQMVNEIDLVFDYVDKNVVSGLKEHIEGFNDAKFANEHIEKFIEDVKPYYDQIRKITGTRKAKSRDFDFLSELKLFSGLLVFDVFREENKNTKRTLVKYIETMYVAACVASDRADSLDVFLETIEEEQKEEQVVATGGIEQVFGSLLKNKEIMNMASELTRDMQNSNIDPMTIMGSIMSGTPNAEVTNLVSSITNKIETRINSGEINRDELEKQARSMMSAIQGSDLAGAGDLTKMFANLK